MAPGAAAAQSTVARPLRRLQGLLLLLRQRSLVGGEPPLRRGAARRLPLLRAPGQSPQLSLCKIRVEGDSRT